ncbi:MAG: pentapeptide repeat-containing protein, partial [Dehalococcoidia bacterium]
MSDYTREEILKLIEERSGPEGLDLAGRDLLGIDLSGVDLHGAILARADLREANLKRTNLRGADLSWAVLQEADLRWADLRQADLRQADLRKASLRWADLREAEIESTDFTGVDLTEVQLAKIERAVPGYGVFLQRRLRGLAVPRAMVSAVALVVLAYLWGWLYRAFYFDEFGLSWTSLSPLSMDYLLRGWQVIALSLKFLLMLSLLSLYALLTISVFLLIPLTLIYYLGNRLLPRLGISQMRWGVLSAMFLAYLVIILLIFPSVIRPLWGWLIEKGVPAKEGFQVFQGFLKALSAVERTLFLAFLALSLAPLWTLYRLLCQRLPEAEVPSSLRSRYPWLDTVLASLKGARPFDPTHPLAPWERYLGLLGAMVVLIAIPTFLTQAGVLHAQSDMCYGGPLPQIELYAKGVLTAALLPPTEEVTGEPQYCLRLLLAENGRYYVFYPHQTRVGEGERTPNVYEVPAEEVDIVYREREACWTCLDEVPAAEEPPVVIVSLATPTATPTSTPTAAPLPPTATVTPIPT